MYYLVSFICASVHDLAGFGPFTTIIYSVVAWNWMGLTRTNSRRISHEEIRAFA